MRTQWRILATAIMFLTRIPVGKSGSGDPKDLAACTQYFPLVGLIVGLITCLVYWIAQILWSNEIAIVMTMLSAVIITGGFHEDGLADVADSAGAWSIERKLEIMRDSRVGTYGAAALILALLLTAFSLIDIANTHAKSSNPILLVMASLILAHVLGRWSSLVIIYTTRYARDDAANKVFVDGVTANRLIIGSLITLATIVIGIFIIPTATLLALGIACVVISLSRLWFLKNIGGITGDCLGAANKVVEVSVYLSFAMVLNS